MDVVDPEHDPQLGAVAEILRRERPALRPDELDRVQRRLSKRWASRRVGLPRSRLLVAVCLAVGIMFMSAGTGLAISGFATPGGAVEAQYPPSPTGAGGQPAREGAKRLVHSPWWRLGQLPLNVRASGIDVRVREAETHVDLPFTGLEAIPVLAIGMALFVTGGVLEHRTGDS